MLKQLDTRLREGQALGGYQLIELIDQRRSVEIWRGQHLHLPLQVVLKVLRLQGQNEEEYQYVEKRLQNEALLLDTLHHQHIVSLRGYLQERRFRALILEYAPLGSIPHYHGSGRKLPLSLIRLYTSQIAGALHVMHLRGLLHRDVKPSNMLLLEPHSALLADFGLAIQVSDLTTQHRPYRGGTPPYMPPEQYHGYPCAASDQYGLATSVYEWLSGHRPFAGETNAMMSRRARFAPRPVRAFRPELPEAVDEILRIALHPQPAQRYPDVLTFAREFASVTKTSRPPLLRRQPYYQKARFQDVSRGVEKQPSTAPRLRRDTDEHCAVYLPALLTPLHV
jgi:serine/threonine protein kinase